MKTKRIDLFVIYKGHEVLLEREDAEYYYAALSTRPDVIVPEDFFEDLSFMCKWIYFGRISKDSPDIDWSETKKFER